jgi:hypothetical protein
VAAPFGWVAARQPDQLLLDVPLDLDLGGARRLGSGVEGRLESLGDQPLAHPFDCPYAAPEGVHDVHVTALLPQGGIRQQEDTRVGQPASRALANGDQPLQRRSFTCIQSDSVLVHGGTPVLEAVHSPNPQEREDRPTRQSKIDDPLAPDSC